MTYSYTHIRKCLDLAVCHTLRGVVLTSANTVQPVPTNRTYKAGMMGFFSYKKDFEASYANASHNMQRGVAHTCANRCANIVKPVPTNTTCIAGITAFFSYTRNFEPNYENATHDMQRGVAHTSANTVKPVPTNKTYMAGMMGFFSYMT